MTHENDFDLGDDLNITKITRRNSGGVTWVSGTLHGHRFDTLVFPEHAEVAEYELGDSDLFHPKCDISRPELVRGWSAF